MSEKFAGKVAVVTGASSGFGATAVRALVAQGMRVVMVARRGDRIQALADELGDQALPFEADVTDGARVSELFSMVRERFGGLDLLFNNAGLGIPGSFQESRPEDWQTMLDINVMGVLRCTQAAIPLMEGRTGAMVCSVSSVGGAMAILAGRSTVRPNLRWWAFMMRCAKRLEKKGYAYP